jgi:hypothetical protein
MFKFKVFNRKGKPIIRLGRKITYPERERRIAEMKARIFFLSVICVCFLGSMLVAKLVKAGVSVNVSTNMTDVKGNTDLKANYSSFSDTQNRYSIDVHGIYGENVHCVNSLSADSSGINTATDIVYEKQADSAGILDSKEKIGIGMSNESECFDAATGSGSSVTMVNSSSIGVTDSGKPGVSYGMQSNGEGQFNAGLEGTYLKYESGKQIEDTEAIYHIGVNGSYDFSGEFYMGK